MNIYDTERGVLINLDNVERVTYIPVENGFELIFNFISGKSHSMFFVNIEDCRRAYRDVLLIMSRED